MPELIWEGKSDAVRAARNIPTRLLEFDSALSVGDGENLIVQGDNLQVMKALLPRYKNLVRCIYIDPPYNTGAVFEHYNDNFEHATWLNFMYPRLEMLREFLSDDGAIFISIDDNEQAHLKLICDEIFGRKNFVANIIWKKKTNGNNMGFIPPVHDFIIVYCKNINQLAPFALPLSEEYLHGKYSNPDNDPRGLWTTTDLSANHKGPYFEITNPKTGEKFFPPKGRYWVFNEAEVLRRIDDGRIIFGKSGNSRPVQKVFAAERDLTRKPDTWFDNQGYNSDATIELAKIIGRRVFDYSKPVKLIQFLMQFATDKNSIVMDAFAGSGTTAHAIINLNQLDGGNRKFILIEEKDYCETITAERVKRVGGEFKFARLGEKLFTASGAINPLVTPEELAAHIWFNRTGTALTEKFSLPLIGIHDDAAIYLLQEILTEKNFSTLPNYDGQKIIYGKACRLSDNFIRKNKIIFKQLPTSI